MNSRVLIAILSVGIVALSYLNYTNKQSYAKKEQSLLIYKQKIDGKNYYLKTISNYALKAQQLSFSNIPTNKNIIIYYAYQACSICVEDFLKTYMKTPSIRERAIVISDNINKDQLTLTFNEAYNKNYDHIIDSTSYFKEEVLDVLIILRKEKEIVSILPYSYEEEEKKYFLEFAPAEFKNSKK